MRSYWHNFVCLEEPWRAEKSIVLFSEEIKPLTAVSLQVGDLENML